MKKIIGLDAISNDVKKAFGSICDCFKNPLIMEPFYKDFKYSFCWSSNAIEGNTLSLDDTITFLEYDEVKSGHTFSEYNEARTLNKAINEFLVFGENRMDSSWLKNLHHVITGLPVGYRDENVYVGNMIELIYYPPDFNKVPELMEKFFSDLNFRSNDIDEVVRKTAEKHMEFERIHPFKDGNGRSGRIILNQCLINNGLLPIIIDPKSKYKQAFKVYDRSGDISLLQRIIYRGELNSIEKIDTLTRNMEASLNEQQPKFSAKPHESLNTATDIQKGNTDIEK